jgi:rhodanese-related sulfurtransferase
VVLYCQGGYRSALAGESLKEMGYSNVLSMSGGFSDWVNNKFPVQQES